MKKLIKFLNQFFISVRRLFSNKKQGKQKIIPESKEKVEKPIKRPKSNNPKVPSHNNRKRTKGRHVQIVSIGKKKKRTIYHES